MLGDDSDSDDASHDDLLLDDDGDDIAMGGNARSQTQRSGPRSGKMPFQLASGALSPSKLNWGQQGSGHMAPPTFNLHVGPSAAAWGTAPQMLPSGAIATPLQPLGAWVVTARLLPPMPSAAAQSIAHLQVYSAFGGNNTRVTQRQPDSAGGSHSNPPLVAVAVLDFASSYCLHMSLHPLTLAASAAVSSPPAGARAASMGASVARSGYHQHSVYAQQQAAPQVVVQVPSYLASAQFVAQLASLQRGGLSGAAEAASAALSAGRLPGPGGPPQVSPALVLSESDADSFSRETMSVVQLQQAHQQQQQQALFHQQAYHHHGGQLHGAGSFGASSTAASGGSSILSPSGSVGTASSLASPTVSHALGPTAGTGGTGAWVSPVARFWADFYARFGSMLGVHSTTSATTDAGAAAASAAMASSGAGLMSLLAGLQAGLAASLAHRTALPLPLVLGPGYGCGGRPAFTFNMWELLQAAGPDASSGRRPQVDPSGPAELPTFVGGGPLAFPRAASPVSPFEAAAATIAGRLGAVHLSRGGGAADGGSNGAEGDAFVIGATSSDTALPPRASWAGDGQCAFPPAGASQPVGSMTAWGSVSQSAQGGATTGGGGGPVPPHLPTPPLPVSERAVSGFVNQWNVRGDVPPGPPALALPAAQAQVVFARLGQVPASGSGQSASGGALGGDSPHVRLASFLERARAVMPVHGA